MNSSSSVNETLPPWNFTKPVLNSTTGSAAIHVIGPSAELAESSSAGELVLYVAHGSLTASVGPANYLLNCDETLVIPAGRRWAARNRGEGPAKLFVLSLPARAPAEPSLVFPQ